MDKMGRKRVANPRISFSISMSQSMKQEIEHRLTYNSDRSKWIVSAIRAKLASMDEADDALGKASMLDLLRELNYRASGSPVREERDMFTRAERETIVLLMKKSKDLPEASYKV